MLKETKLLKNLWAEAFEAAWYINEIYGAKQNVSRLQIYACTVFWHVFNEKREAFDDHSESKDPIQAVQESGVRKPALKKNKQS